VTHFIAIWRRLLHEVTQCYQLPDIEERAPP